MEDEFCTNCCCEQIRETPIIRRPLPKTKPKITQFLSSEELSEFLNMENDAKIKKFIGEHLMRKDYQKNQTTTILHDLMYSTAKFCKNSNFSIEQSSTVLSLFYTTHIYFINEKNKPAADLYTYFKELLFRFSLPFESSEAHIFSLNDCKKIIQFYIKMYAQNLPLIRLLNISERALLLNYKLEPELKKGKKGKK